MPNLRKLLGLLMISLAIVLAFFLVPKLNTEISDPYFTVKVERFPDNQENVLIMKVSVTLPPSLDTSELRLFDTYSQVPYPYSAKQNKFLLINTLRLKLNDECDTLKGASQAITTDAYTPQLAIYGRIERLESIPRSAPGPVERYADFAQSGTYQFFLDEKFTLATIGEKKYEIYFVE